MNIHLDPKLDTLLRETLQRHSLTDIYGQIIPRARLTFLLRVSATSFGDDIPIGISRFGGTPDFPPGFNWPVNPEDGLLLNFIGQINLAQLPDAGQVLPNAGLLQLFSQQESACENPHAIQLQNGPAESLIRAESPSEEMFSDEDAFAPKKCVIVTEFVPSVSLPDSISAFPDFDDDTHDAFSELVSELHDDQSQKEPTSRLLGYPFSGDGSALPSDEWELLAEVESHFDGGECYMNFWDAGSLQVMVPRSQLRECTFKESAAAIFSL